MHFLSDGNSRSGCPDDGTRRTSKAASADDEAIHCCVLAGALEMDCSHHHRARGADDPNNWIVEIEGC